MHNRKRQRPIKAWFAVLFVLCIAGVIPIIRIMRPGTSASGVSESFPDGVGSTIELAENSPNDDAALYTEAPSSQYGMELKLDRLVYAEGDEISATLDLAGIQGEDAFGLSTGAHGRLLKARLNRLTGFCAREYPPSIQA
jgi:hypothetical protein